MPKKIAQVVERVWDYPIKIECIHDAKTGISIIHAWIQIEKPASLEKGNAMPKKKAKKVVKKSAKKAAKKKAASKKKR